MALLIMLADHPAYPYQIGGFDVKPRGEVSEGYDDNINFVKNNPVKDCITALSVGLSGTYRNPLSLFALDVNVTQQLFGLNPSFNNTSEDLTAAFSGELTKYTAFNMKEVFTHTYEPTGIAEQFGRVGGRYSYLRNRLDLSYVQDIGSRFDVTVSDSNAIDAPSLVDTSDSYFNRSGIALGYKLSELLKFSGYYDFSFRAFDPGRNALINTAGLSLKYQISPRFLFEGKTGMDAINSYSGKYYVKPLLLASLTGDLDKKTSASVAFTREYFTTPYEQDLFDFWQIAGGATRQLSKRMDGLFSVFYGQGRYVNLDLDYNFFGSSVELNYEFTEDIKGKVSYAYSRNDSNTEALEYAKNGVYITIAYRK